MAGSRDTSSQVRTSSRRSDNAGPTPLPEANGRALLQIDATGSITSMSAGARDVLGYAGRDPIDPCFFAHIHGRNLLQVMHDVASMVCSGKKSARWVLRMKTSTPSWIWLRLHASTLGPRSAPSGIRIQLERVDA